MKHLAGRERWTDDEFLSVVEEYQDETMLKNKGHLVRFHQSAYQQSHLTTQRSLHLNTLIIYKYSKGWVFPASGVLSQYFVWLRV